MMAGMAQKSERGLSFALGELVIVANAAHGQVRYAWLVVIDLLWKSSFSKVF